MLKPAAEPETGLEERENVVILSKKRRLVALEAAWEIETLCTMLRGAVKPNEDMEHLAVRGLAARINNLAAALMSLLGDDGAQTAVVAKDVRMRARGRTGLIPAT